MSKYILILFFMVQTVSKGYAGDCSLPQFFDQVTPVSQSASLSPCIKPWFSHTQIGLAFEENSVRRDIYAYLNGYLKEHWYYEVRGYGIWRFITEEPPTVTPPINNREQKNSYGTGFATILGYAFQLPGSKASLRPYFRYEARQNITGPVYKDRRHNEASTWEFGYLAGIKLSMPVNEQLSVAIQYWGGFTRLNLHGKGFFARNHNLAQTSIKRTHYYFIQENLQFSFTYNINKCWVAIACWKLSINNNNPGASITDAPSPYEGRVTSLTTYNYLWGMKIGYNF